MHTQLGIGQLNVTVPEGVHVVVNGRSVGRQSTECCPSNLRVDRPSGGGTLFLDADVGAGARP